MPTLVYRIAKRKYAPFDGTGAYLEGGRWNSAGRVVIYGSTCLAGSLLEILAHAAGRHKLPGPHHCGRAEIPDEAAIESVDESRLTGWDEEDSAAARAYGDAWLAEARTVALSVPAVTARPWGRHLLLNPAHPEFALVRIREPVPIVWDARLLRV